MSVGGQTVAEARCSLNLLPLWEQAPHRGSQGLRTPEKDISENVNYSKWE